MCTLALVRSIWCDETSSRQCIAPTDLPSVPPDILYLHSLKLAAIKYVRFEIVGISVAASCAQASNGWESYGSSSEPTSATHRDVLGVFADD